MKLFYAAAALLLGACALQPDFYAMRHLEKAQDGLDPVLTDDGTRHAEALYDFLKPHFPRAIYASNTRRAQLTAGPLATRLGLTLNVYNMEDTAGMIARVRAEPNKPVLVVGHSNTVPEIVRRLGGVEPRPLRDDEFRHVFWVHGDGATRVKRMPE